MKKEHQSLSPAHLASQLLEESLWPKFMFLYLEQAIEPGIEVPFAFIVELRPISLKHRFLT